MKTIKLSEPRTISCVETEKPVPGQNEALIRIQAAGICGSDIGAFRGTNKLVSYPRVIGHELAGIIEAIPEDNPKGLTIGDRVIIDPYLYCAVIGAGPIGLLAGMIAQAYGAHAILLDLVQERLDFAKELGIEHVINSGKEDVKEAIRKITGGTMAQLVMECSGSNAAIRSTLDFVSNAGRITLTGWPPRETSIPTDLITRKEIDIRGARTSAGEFEKAIDLIYTKRVDVRKILTRTGTLEEAPELIRNIEKNPGDYMKVVIRME